MSDALARALITIGESTELAILVKATLIMLMGLGAAQLAARARASVRHVLLAATFGALALLPVAVLLVPAARIRIVINRPTDPAVFPIAGQPPSPGLSTGVSNRESSAGPSVVSMPTPATILRFGWASGFAFLVAGVGISLWRLHRMRRLAYPWPERHALVDAVAGELGLRKHIALALHEDLGAPITCGTRRPAVILPSDAMTWSDADVRRALMHEMEHVRRNDWAIQIAVRGICALYWFHPLVWTLWRQFCLEAERACDDAVLSVADRVDYADQLVHLAQRMTSASTVATLTMASRSDLSTRVSAILDGTQKRGPVGMIPMTMTATAAFVAALGLAPLRAVEMPRERESVQAAQQTTQKPDSITFRVIRANRLDQALYEAATDGDIEQMTALIGAGANANAPLPGDGSALMGAASHGHLAAVRFLLDQAVDPNLAVSGDGTALIVASRDGRADVVTLLLDRGADLEQVVPGDENALIQASGNGRLDVVRLLVSRRANVNARVWSDRNGPAGVSGEWRSPLSMAKRGGHQAVVEYLITAGAIE